VRRALALALGLVLFLAPSAARADVQVLVGQPAPAVRARPLYDDGEVGLARYRGRVVVLAFVATWCSACRRVAPALEALHEAHREDGLVLLAMSHETRARLRQHAEANPRRYPVLQCTGRTAVSYHADGLPTLVLIDRRGRVHRAYQGGTDAVLSALRRDVAALLEGPPQQ